MCLGLIAIFDKSGAMVILAVFNTREHVGSWRVFQKRSFEVFK